MPSLTVAGLIAAVLSITTTAAAQCAPGAGPRIINGRTCTVQCGIDRRGGDYDRAYTGTFEGCIQLCAAASTCVTAQYHGKTGWCYLKDSRNPAETNVDDDTPKVTPVYEAPNALLACAPPQITADRYREVIFVGSTVNASRRTAIKILPHRATASVVDDFPVTHLHNDNYNYPRLQDTLTATTTTQTLRPGPGKAFFLPRTIRLRLPAFMMLISPPRAGY
ncbi:uncharacterized protein AB675_2387 [Cyphellophora attinorum]|uniref:Apple domain-containing protein n=1 Tax=Cyphellophora attinorum TaxID=1664694 RepID=A0A0N1HG31_9EURO|nr:uncharacterized protein AB675_2387 [Phialophora attinorum]KPI45005.1 hypothetical protein AB675_2387 [Phialophora attinorum]